MKFSIRRGRKNLTTKIKKHSKYLADCRNCNYYIPDEDGCSNINVTKYDFCEGEGRKYCPFWMTFVYESEGI